MGLLELADVRPLFVCPRCGFGVTDGEGGFRCNSAECALSAPGSFPIVERWPTLVDFEHSILPRAELERSATGGRNPWSIERLPRVLRPVWKPRNRVAARNIQTLLEELPGEAPVILVIGGGVVGNGVEAIYEDPRAGVVAFDIYGTPLVQFIADAHRIPLPDKSVGGVLIQAVLQQVLDPDRVVAEIHRVLRPDGLVYAESPFLQQVAYAGPYDFVRYTSSGHRYLFRAFEEIAAGPVAGPGAQMVTSVDHLVRGLLRSELAGKLARAAFFWLRYLDRFIPPAFAMDNASAYYFLGRRSERELSAREIIDYYRGAHRSAVTDD
ncbi:MAG TPA: class I SAM-dependent methyltransferase [Solirubrobacterales bacterium]|nr:class I SAM-dependent methyltransferase [Solirubrobacterales bacterium]